MILIVLPCTLIGWLCGAPLVGLGVGLVLWAWATWDRQSGR